MLCLCCALPCYAVLCSAVQQIKADMKAYSELRRNDLEGKYGLMPGTTVGSVFSKRAEAALLGLHNSLIHGIDNRCV